MKLHTEPSRWGKVTGVEGDDPPAARTDSGIDVTTALVVVGEIGSDTGRFPTNKHFASWLGLCPGTRITGGLVVSGKTKRFANRAAQALPLAAAP